MSLKNKISKIFMKSCFLCGIKPATRDPYTVQYSRTIIGWHLQPKKRQIYMKTRGLGNNERVCDSCFEKVKEDSFIMEQLRIGREILMAKLKEEETAAKRFNVIEKQPGADFYSTTYRSVANELLLASINCEMPELLLEYEIQLLALLIAYIEHQTINSKGKLTGSLLSKLNELFDQLHTIEDVENLLTNLYPSLIKFDGFEEGWGGDTFFQKAEGMEDSYHLTRTGILLSVKKKIQQFYLKEEKASQESEFMYL